MQFSKLSVSLEAQTSETRSSRGEEEVHFAAGIPALIAIYQTLFRKRGHH